MKTLREGIQAVRAFRPEEGVRLSRLRLIEIAIAVALTMAALLFFAWTAWADDRGQISVADSWVRPTIGEGTITAAYMTLANTGAVDDVLVKASSPKAAKVEIHQTKMTDEGVMTMRPVENGLPIAAGGKVELTPGGYHLMVMGLGAPLPEGSELPLTLEFEKAGPMEIVVPVRAKAGGGHGHH